MIASRLRRLVALTFFAAAVPSFAATQELERPAGWLDRPDQPGADMSEVYFVAMPPGWHVTSGPAAIYYDPGNMVSGEYSVESEIFLFDPNGRREAFGIFVGGDDLQGDGQRYVYFLIRPTGEFIVKKREGADAPTLIGWTAHDAVVPWSAKEEGEETVVNVLGIRAASETVHFMVNGEEVATLPRADLDLDGTVGLRVNHAVNIHVSSLDVKGPDDQR